MNILIAFCTALLFNVSAHAMNSNAGTPQQRHKEPPQGYVSQLLKQNLEVNQNVASIIAVSTRSQARIADAQTKAFEALSVKLDIVLERQNNQASFLKKGALIIHYYPHIDRQVMLLLQNINCDNKQLEDLLKDQEQFKKMFHILKAAGQLVGAANQRYVQDALLYGGLCMKAAEVSKCDPQLSQDTLAFCARLLKMKEENKLEKAKVVLSGSVKEKTKIFENPKV